MERQIALFPPLPPPLRPEICMPETNILYIISNSQYNPVGHAMDIFCANYVPCSVLWE